jgi:hypothetical protein
MSARPLTSTVRDGSRDGSAPPARRCPACAGPLPSARARYCSPACKQRAYRHRHRDATAPPPPPTATATTATTARQRHESTVAHTVYECPSCGERFLGERRCPDCHLFCRSLGPGGRCPHCEEPVLLADLLGKEVLP